jgi:hypothetical protein
VAARQACALTLLCLLVAGTVAAIDPADETGLESGFLADEQQRHGVAHVGQTREAAARAAGDGSPERPLRVVRSTTPIKVDGLLDEPAWHDALRLKLSYETVPGNNTPALVQTEALVTYDRHTLYVGFRAHDPDPKRIQAHLSDHDSISGDDQLGIEIDTFNDERRCYNFFINPLGVQEDSIAKGTDWDFSWDTIWEAKTQLHDWGYSAEIAVPFSSIRIQRTDGPQVWGFNAQRAWVRDRQYWFGALALDRDNSCRWCQLIKIEGFEGVESGNDIELIPAVTMIGTSARPDFPYGELENQGEELEGALTAHWGLTPNLTFSGTLNPDFSQVEADALQLDINEPFALFYEEKRPFFSEGADFFLTPMDVVHTRVMRDPSWGLKVSGKEEAHSLGSYLVQDRVTNLLFPGPRRSSQTSLEHINTSTILRYAKDFGSRYTVGALVTDREGTDYFNRVAGIDASIRLGRADDVEVQAITSSTRYPDDVAVDFAQPFGTFDDGAILVAYTRNTRAVGWWANYRQVGRDFRADLGFMPRAGFREAAVGARHAWWADPGAWWSRIEVGGEAESGEDEDGFVLRRDAGAWLRYQGTLHSWLFVGGWRGTEGYAGQEFDFQDIEVSGGVRPTGSLKLDIRSWFGDQLDYRNGRIGRRIKLRPELVWNASTHLVLELRNTFERMDVQGQRYYDAAVSQATIAYQFNVRTFVRAILQYVDYDYAEEALAKASVQDDVERLFTQLLYSYKLNPRSVLFVGYTENSAGGPEFDLTEVDRTLFVKVGYSLSF